MTPSFSGDTTDTRPSQHISYKIKDAQRPSIDKLGTCPVEDRKVNSMHNSVGFSCVFTQVFAWLNDTTLHGALGFGPFLLFECKPLQSVLLGWATTRRWKR